MVMKNHPPSPKTREERFEKYLSLLSKEMDHADRIGPFRHYLAGLLLQGERKSIEPIAARIDPTRVCAKHQSLHHFIAVAAWNDRALLRVICQYTLLYCFIRAKSKAGLLTILDFPNAVSIRSASSGNTVANWARRRIARSLCLSLFRISWRLCRLLSISICRSGGPMIGRGGKRLVCRLKSSFAPSAKLPLRKLTPRSSPVCLAGQSYCCPVAAGLIVKEAIALANLIGHAVGLFGRFRRDHQAVRQFGHDPLAGSQALYGGVDGVDPALVGGFSFGFFGGGVELGGVECHKASFRCSQLTGQILRTRRILVE
jgi:hypothetical protein